MTDDVPPQAAAGDLYGLALVVVIAPIAYAVAHLSHRGLTPPPAP